MKTDIYKSKAWKKIRLNVCLEQGCLCARCSRPVYVSGISQWIPKEKRLKGIVHHKEYLTDENYTDDHIAYDESNLELLCIDCHNREHYLKATRQDVRFDEDGNLVPIIKIKPSNE